ncbi:hypothetical protein Slin15195_G038150 [Septoria linicola]|uniref:Uncharacterized protein n=1 Tax=Septoria linicola TaxID=215465 RepID=A0A9Q9AR22_9PEZI|nr:hypothetical protein Slin14017_G119550 [Septoria linicola]USW50496.1 hypothetical protein Slin15195_G038150 [Septoria linicola]
MERAKARIRAIAHKLGKVKPTPVDKTTTEFLEKCLDKVLVFVLPDDPNPSECSRQRQRTIFELMFISKQFARVIRTSDLLQGFMYQGQIETDGTASPLPHHGPLIWLFDRISSISADRVVIEPKVHVNTHVLGLIVKLNPPVLQQLRGNEQPPRKDLSRDMLELSLGGMAWNRLDASWRRVKISTASNKVKRIRHVKVSANPEVANHVRHIRTPTDPNNANHIRLVIEGLQLGNETASRPFEASASRTWFLGHADTLGKVYDMLRKLLAVLDDVAGVPGFWQKGDDVEERLRAIERRTIWPGPVGRVQSMARSQSVSALNDSHPPRTRRLRWTASMTTLASDEVRAMKRKMSHMARWEEEDNE